MSCSYTFAVKAARVCYNTVRAHERNDPEFAAQLREAEQEGAELLHDVCWKSAVEGDTETVYYMGIPVGYVKKFDSRLRIEMLRAHMPQKFKSPGVNVNVNQDNRTAFVVTQEIQDALIAKRRQALERIKEAEGQDTTPTQTNAVAGLLGR